MFFVLFVSLLQKVSEKVGGAEGTKLDDDFTEMEKARLSSLHERVSMEALRIKVSLIVCLDPLLTFSPHFASHFCSPDSLLVSIFAFRGWTSPLGQCWTS